MRPPAGDIRVGIGGWSYEPWRETFYPPGLPAREWLYYASRQMSAIEVNSTFYGAQKPATFEKWHEATPDDFVFSLKAPRVATHRRDLGEAQASVERFIKGGIDRLGKKLGPILWQFPPTKAFQSNEFEAFLESLPKRLGSRNLRHVLDVRHASFACAEFVALARRYQLAICITDAADVPNLHDRCADLVYLRLRSAQSRLKTGYSLPTLKRWAEHATEWSQGRAPKKLTAILEPNTTTPADVFLYFINGAKERAPAAAVRTRKLLSVS